jgi:hypothetical protein
MKRKLLYYEGHRGAEFFTCIEQLHKYMVLGEA